MFLKTSFQKTLQIIKKNKALFVLLFVTQLVFILVFASVQLNYQVKVVQNFKDIIDPLQNTQFDPNKPVNPAFLEDVNQIVENWQQLKINLSYLILFTFLSFALFNGLTWTLTHHIIKKHNFFKIWGKFAALTTLFSIAYLFIAYLIFQSPLFFNDPVTASKIWIGLAVIMSYFALISFTFINLKFKEIFRKTFWEIGIKKIHQVLLVYFVIFIILAILSYLLFQAITFWPFTLAVLLLVILILVINISRIFLIHSLLEIA